MLASDSRCPAAASWRCFFRDWRNARAAVLTVAVLFAGSGGCVRGRSLHTLAAASNEISVVHVRSEGASLAGFPIDEYVAVTLASPGDFLGVAVVDGVPAGDCTSQPSALRDVVSSSPPWRVLWTDRPRFTPNPLTRNSPLFPGRQVGIAGFDPEPADPGRSAYWTRPPRRLLGEVRDIGWDQSFGVAVPRGDYSSFLGGPVFLDGNDGRPAVCGMVTAIELGLDNRECVLRATKIDEIATWLDAARHSRERELSKSGE